METVPVFIIVGLLIGFSKGGLGGPVPIALTAPLLTSTMPAEHAEQAIAIILPLLMFGDLMALYAYWKDWDMRYIRIMLLPAIVGIFIGSLLLATLPGRSIKHLLAIFTLIAVAYKILRDNLATLSYEPRNWHGWIAGGASGFGSALANVGAPPFTAYMLLQPNITPRSFIGTSTLFFAIMNFIKLPTFLAAQVISLEQLLSVLWVVFVIPIGVWIGRRTIERIDTKTFEWIMIIPLVVLAIALLFS